ncbi:MAG TPA: hypothetical protein VLU25_09855, partial [Acidobacteriota bacterium]|nr:hypothetical protein [Acidobacteriota bacterium]
MSHQKARRALNDNDVILKPLSNDPVKQALWNLTKGLFEVSRALEADLRDVQNRLSRLESQVKNLE